MRVQVYLRPTEAGRSQGVLELSEIQEIELRTLSDAAEILVKLHEFFEALRRKGGAS